VVYGFIQTRLPAGDMAKSKLSDYAAKRTFGATPEPAPGAERSGSGPLLFVVQLHSARRLHYDFRLECDGVLKSWAVPKGPSLNVADRRLAVMTEDHPFDYASFEGVIPPRQYGAGEVIVWDCGVYTPDESGSWYHDRDEAERQVREGLAQGKLSFFLRGHKLKGSFALVRTAKDPKSWLLIKHKDRFANTSDITGQNRSVLHGAAVEELKVVRAQRIAAAKLVPHGRVQSMPQRMLPMLAETVEAPFKHPDWMWEPKLDGYRVLAFVSAQGVQLRSRREIALSRMFPRLVAELAQQQVSGMVLDGELVAFDAKGKPSFNALQNRAQLKTDAAIVAAARQVAMVFYCFDLLYFAGIDLRRAPYQDRRRYLTQCLLPTPMIQLVHSLDDGVALQEAALASGFEGVVGKRKDSPYRAGARSAAWVKVKPVQTAEFVVGGFTKGKGSREALGALLVGYWEQKQLRFASHVGSGFDARTLQQTRKRLEPLQRSSCPFAEQPPLLNPTIWVEPKLVAELKFQSWTDDQHLRAPVFVRLREDIDPKSVRRRDHREAMPAKKTKRGDSEDREIEAVLAQLDTRKAEFPLIVGGHRIKLTHLDRVYWPAAPALQQPALTKRDLLRYFAQVARFILPHLRDRPLTMIRMPDGIHKQRFFQKHWEQKRPEFAETVTLFSSSKNENHEYLLCNNLPTLFWLAQSGTLEFHVWHSRARPASDSKSKSTDYASSLQSLEASVLNYPDYVVFDLDPYIYSGKEKPGDEPELNNVAFEKGKEVAFWLRELLESMSLESIVKTSGKTGLHIFVPIRRTIDFDAAREVSELVGRHLMRMHPKDITLEWSIPKRTGKIFMDYNMNVRGKTLNVAYSPRGIAGAPVSMPLTWEELAQAHPLDFRMTNAAQRMEETGDRWADALKRKQSLGRALNGAKS
jgi:bifunctional non-homologous end joining protein LigD